MKIRILGLGVAFVALAFAASPIRAAEALPPAPPIREFGLAMTERLGREIYLQDSAAWVATDALQLKVPDLAAAHMIGWIVVPHGQNEEVRFLRDIGNGPEAGYDVDVDRKLHAVVTEPANRRLTADELAAFAARQTASHALTTACRAGYNSVVARDPEGDGWLVWLLAPTPTLGAIPFGGHYRFTISRDGKAVLRRDALSASCMTMQAPPKTGQGSKPAMAVVTHVVSSTPVETHVFLQLQAKTPFMVVAGGRVWLVDDGQISDHGPIPSQSLPAK
ncbi:hypothetical protein [Phenylobacterium sp.]|uniref:hypothetical protein n=1 Tax=Phenylobacterium sp. TaxID=1871053 RepID=UPI0035663A9C